MIAIGNINAGKIYLGGTEVGKIYLGGTQIWGGSGPGPTPAPYVDWLKSIGCIVYLPLDEEGATTDLISELSLTLTGNGVFEWNADNGMYRLKSPSGAAGTYVALLSNSMNANSFPEDVFTTLATVKRISTSGYIAGYMSPLATVETTQVALNPLYNTTGNIGNWPNGVLNLGYVWDTTSRHFYQQGALYGDYTKPSGYAPSEWSLAGNGFVLGMLRSVPSTSLPSYRNKEIYIKNVMVFNKALTLEQIRKIQGYD